MRVEVYWNLHQGCFSVRALEGRHKGRVIGHADRLVMRDVTFTVQPAGREKVRREKRKNVHAFVRGTLEGAFWDDRAKTYIGWTREDVRYARWSRTLGQNVTYNPYKDDSFVTLEGDQRKPIQAAPMVTMHHAYGRPVMLAFEPCDIPEAA